MMLRGPTGGWWLFFLAAIVPGARLQTNHSTVRTASDSELHSEAQVYRLVLQPSEAIPTKQTYTLKTPAGKPCIKATLGAEYIVIENKKTWYFSLDPSRVTTSGTCSNDRAVLSLELPNNTASLKFTFIKENNTYYVTNLTAQLSPQPVCQRCANKTYTGMMGHEKLFRIANGWSYSCKSGSLFRMSSNLRIKLVPLQMQAFTLQSKSNGKEVECWADFNRRVIPIILGATVVALILIAVITFLFIKDRRRPGYNRL